jgi:hypothetical protein
MADFESSSAYSLLLKLTFLSLCVYTSERLLPATKRSLPHWRAAICSRAQLAETPYWELRDMRAVVELPNGTLVPEMTISTYRPTLPTCSVGAMTPAIMQTCLTGRHVMMIGDSASRLMFFSLASALEYGVFVDWQPVSHAGGTVDSWAQYYNATTTKLRHAVCDCERDWAVRIQGEEGEEVPKDICVQYYRNPLRNLEVTYVSAMGKDPHVGWHEPRAFGVDCEKSSLGSANVSACAAELPCEAGRCAGLRPFYDQRWDVALRHLVLRTKPWALVLNSGLWGVQWSEGGTLGRLLVALEWAKAEGGVKRIVWRSTTAVFPSSPSGYLPGQFDVFFAAQPHFTRREDLVMEEFRKRGWLVVDTGAASQPLADLALFSDEARDEIYFKRDPIHFTTRVFHGLNELLLGAIC